VNQARQKLKSQVKYAFRRTGVEVGSYRWTIANRRGLLLGNCDVLADVGANVGQYATDVRRAGWTGQIVSYEPLMDAFAKLERRASHDLRWAAVRSAVGREAGELTINVSQNSVFSSALSTLPRGKSVYDRMDVVRTERAPLATLDSLMAEHLDSGRRIGVKVDVQGFERDVLLGAERVLAAASYWEMELTPVELYEGQMLMVEALERLRDAGLNLVAVENIFGDADTGRSLQFNGLFSRT
jgi:FkbM family methyltransferase